MMRSSNCIKFGYLICIKRDADEVLGQAPEPNRYGKGRIPQETPTQNLEPDIYYITPLWVSMEGSGEFLSIFSESLEHVVRQTFNRSTTADIGLYP